MFKNMLRALALASLSLFVTTAVVAPTAAYAADKSKKDGDSAKKMSKGVSKLAVEAGKLMEAKDWQGAIAKLTEAQAKADQTDYDKYIVNYYLGVCNVRLNDFKTSADFFYAAALVPNVPVEDHNDVVAKTLMVTANTNNYARIVEISKSLVTSDAQLTEMLAMIIGTAYHNIGDYQNAIAYANKSIDIAVAAGRTPDHEVYQTLLSSYGHLKNLPEQVKLLEKMCSLFGRPDDWSYLNDVTFNAMSTIGSKGNRETAAFFLYRLRLIVKADASTEDYQLAADLAFDQNSPGDVVNALSRAEAAGKITAKGRALLAKSRNDARADEATLSKAETAVAKAPNGTQAVSVAEGYFGYGKYADAARVAQVAVGKGGPKLNEALMVLGAAQTMLGQDDAAAATFARVKGDKAFERVAQIWTIYATRKYGRVQTAPASAPTN